LFEELPSHIKKVTIHEVDEDDGFDVEVRESIEEVAKAKQFIAFSDSRQAAAYFSSYFSVSYDGILYGRLIRETLKSSKQNQIEMVQFIGDLYSKMKENNIIPFDDYLHCLKTKSVASYDYEKIKEQDAYSIAKLNAQSSSKYFFNFLMNKYVWIKSSGIDIYFYGIDLKDNKIQSNTEPFDNFDIVDYN
jgi:hypothetical protein